MATTDDYERVTALDELAESGREVVSVGGHTVALFYHEGEVYAVDNRCPHMGFPLAKGSVDDGLLTCHWHHARFELACGDTFDVWADDVQTFPTDVRDDAVYVDPDPPQDVPPETHWRNRLVDGVQENLGLVIAKSVIHLDNESLRDSERATGEQSDPRATGFDTALETAVSFGTNYRESGWGSGLTTLGAMANVYDRVGHEDRLRALYVGIGQVASDCAGEPPRHPQYELGNADLSKERLKTWFRETCEVRDEDGAERCLRTAAAVLPPEDVTEILLAAATDHLYMNASHTLDFVNKAVETLDHVGWDEAEDVLASVVPQITGGARAEETSTWTQPVDVADLCFETYERLPELVAAGEGSEWERPDHFVADLLDDDPHAIVERLETAIRNGATARQLIRAVSLAATRRVAQFATSNEFSDWNTVHHTWSYTNAAHELTRRTDAIEAYRPAIDGAMSVYLDRFLNQPAAPIPEPGRTGRDPAAIREALLDTFDRQGGVDEAAALVAEHFAVEGDPRDLERALGEGLLREDAGFHTLQSYEAALRLVDHADSEAERRLPLIATARYMAAHFPTRREREQTFRIAQRLFRGESIHGEE